MKDEKKILSEPQEICGKRYGVPFYAQNCGGGDRRGDGKSARFLLSLARDGDDGILIQDGTPTPRTGKILAATPMHRFGEASELYGALLFLLSEAASFITGVILPVDGGFSAYSGV